MTRSEDRADAFIDGARVKARLLESGFEVAGGPSSSGHLLLTRGALHAVVPAPDRVVPARVLQMLEISLAPALGERWLTSDAEALGETDSSEVVVLDVIVLDPDGDGNWCAFLTDDLAVVGFGQGRTDALHDLKSAAAVRLGIPEMKIVLVTPDVV